MEFFHEFLNFHFVRSFSKELHFSLFCQNVSEINLSETFVSKIFFLENIEICFFRIFFSKVALINEDSRDTYYISSDFPYTTHTPESPTLNERELSDLMAHLEDEIPELIQKRSILF